MATLNSTAARAETTAPSKSSTVLNNLVIFRKSGLTFLRDPALHTWELVGQELISMMESSTWWLADWLAYGERTFQDRYHEAIRRTGLNYQTLRNYAWVARRFELSRRRDSLSFGHHAELAALDRAEQEFWLRKAVELKWSRNQLRSEVRTSLQERQRGRDTVSSAAQPDRPSASGSDEARPGDYDAAANAPDAGDGDCAWFADEVDGLRGIYLKVTEQQFDRFATAAEEQRLPLEQWVIEILTAAALGRELIL